MSEVKARDAPNRPVCPNCHSRFVRARVRTNDYWCRRCGVVFSILKSGDVMYHRNPYTGDKVFKKR